MCFSLPMVQEHININIRKDLQKAKDITCIICKQIKNTNVIVVEKLL